MAEDPKTATDPLKVAPAAAKTSANTPTMGDKGADAQKAAEEAEEARVAAEDAKLSPEEREARAAERKAAHAKSEAALASAPAPKEPDTVATAGVLAPVDPGMLAGDHMAQKFGNDPANPKPAKHVTDDYDGPKTRLQRITPDMPEPAICDVHPDMVGDYLRAGWSLSA